MFAKNYYLHWTGVKAEQMFSVKIYYIYIFSIFSKAFVAPFHKKILKQFLLHCTSICMSSKSVSQIFKILFQTGNINIFVLHGVFFGRSVQLKSSFSDKKKHQQ